jgi:hypothetical protein
MVQLTDAQWKAVQQHLGAYIHISPSSDVRFAVQQLVSEIDRANGIETYIVWVRWRDAATPHPRLIDEAGTWPPELTASMTDTKPISKGDVEAFVNARTPKPAGIWISRDPTGRVGWKRIEDWP